MNTNDAKLILNYMDAPVITQYTYQTYRINGFQRLDDDSIQLDVVNLANEKQDNVKINLSDQRNLLKLFRYFWNQIVHNAVNEDGQMAMQINLNDLVGKSLLVVSEEFHIGDDAEVAASLVSITVLDKLGVKLLVE